ncbi:MAG: hypothetical protein CL897_05155 [Dehalococcoidia bacterium]|nr:hypothetical protein [Dehalococcoidia bacterium]
MNLGILAGIGSAAIWAAASTLMASSSTRIDALSVSTLRAAWSAIALLVVTPFVVISGGFDALDAGVVLAVVGSAILGNALGDTLYVASLNALGLTRAFTISLGLFVFLTYIFGIALLGYDITVAEALGSVLVLVGVYVVSLRGRRSGSSEPTTSPPGRNLIRGLALVAAAALIWALATVWLGDVVEGQNAIALNALRLPATALVLGFAVGVVPGSSIRKRAISRRDHGALFVAGIFGTAVGSLLFIYAVQEAGVGRAAVATAISPLFAVPLGAIFLKEQLTLWLVAGVVVAVVGIVLIS